MQIETFKVFRDLVDTTSFSKAAEANGITQSAVSQQVRSIERRYHVRLIDRGKRYFALTAEGHAFLEASRSILDAYESLGRRIHEIGNEVAGGLRIAAVYSIGLHELPPYLKRYRRKFPRVEVTVDYCRSDEAYSAVLAGRSEIALVAYPGRRTGLKNRTLWRDRLVLICSPEHRLADAARVSLDEISGEKFVAFEPDLPTRREIDRRLRERKITVRRILEFDNIETVKRAVGIENAVSIVPDTSVQDEVRGRTLVSLPIDEDDMWRTVGAVIRRGAALSPAAKEFLAMLEKHEAAVH